MSAGTPKALPETFGEAGISLREGCRPQGSARTWSELRHQEPPLIASTRPQTLSRVLRVARSAGSTLALVYTGTREAARQSDFVLTPSRRLRPRHRARHAGRDHTGRYTHRHRVDVLSAGWTASHAGRRVHPGNRCRPRARHRLAPTPRTLQHEENWTLDDIRTLNLPSSAVMTRHRRIECRRS